MDSVHISTLLGPLEIGALLSLFLLGVHALQTYIYFARFPKDPKSLKSMVATLCLLEAIHAGALSDILYTVTISNFGQVAELDHFSGSGAIIVSSFASQCVNILLQVYLTRRIHILSGKLHLPVLLWSLSTLSFLALIVCSALLPLEQYWHQTFILIIVFLHVNAVAYFIIAASLYRCLKIPRGEVIHSTARLVRRLMRWTVVNGLISSTVGVASAILFIDQPPFVWIATISILQQCYSISFLASINARKGLRSIADNHTVLMPPVHEHSTIRFSYPMANGTITIETTNHHQTLGDSMYKKNAEIAHSEFSET